MIRITMIADEDIEDISALKLENLLKALEVDVKRTSIKRLSKPQYDKALAR